MTDALVKKGQPLHRLTAFDWIRLLEAESAHIKEMNLACELSNYFLQGDGTSFALSSDHNRLIAHSVDTVCSMVCDSRGYVKILLKNMIAGKVFDNYCELISYYRFSQEDSRMRIQVKLPCDEVLSRSCPELDGVIDNYVCFDVKSFNLNFVLMSTIKTKLACHFPNKDIIIEGALDVDQSDLQKIVGRINDLIAALEENNIVSYDNGMAIKLQDKSSLAISFGSNNPYRLAELNETIVFKDANQFTKEKPFVLVYGMHPWINRSPSISEFNGSKHEFMRSLSRRAFMKYAKSDLSIERICGICEPKTTLGAASELLSGILFMDVFPDTLRNDLDKGSHYLYLNPNAKNRLFRNPFVSIENKTFVEGFCYDNY